MTRYILTMGFLLICSIVHSQQQIILEGKIVGDSLENSQINIINLTRKTGTTNSDLGEFTIEVIENDTLSFSSVQYETVTIKISDKIISQKFLKIKLTPKVIDLDEVLIQKTDLTGNLSQDIGKINTHNYYEGIPLPKKAKLTSIGRKLYTARDGDIDPLLNMISGRMQMLEKAQENEHMALDVQEGMDAIESSVFIHLLQIPEEEIINFVYYCATSPSYKKQIENNDYLELIELFKEKAPVFRELRRIKPAANGR
ncbi:carboxypeptidase-like regulatory domain-containing protein [Salinimicrobium sediminilitoris]|uniref:carboxypeptidase-like regulatory domain-containing protein n=1 Tax=Salinimicrobium sediminilitoris TaxID=2876715 RepID=UPI001E468398|nr:carboxypeptidase-like regulatory domain-containing protein [Salinimicrobium sediminilitoris]MCC8358922.1 carboxypeptidase-like regulatory domain-containing protein [Salinimicrobium sediminilitoris]